MYFIVGSVRGGTNQKRLESRVLSGNDINDPGRTRGMRQREKNGVAETKGKRENKEQKTIKARQKGLS